MRTKEENKVYMRNYRQMKGTDAYYLINKCRFLSKTPCPICNKFISNCNLQRHINNIHN